MKYYKLRLIGSNIDFIFESYFDLKDIFLRFFGSDVYSIESYCDSLRINTNQDNHALLRILPSSSHQHYNVDDIIDQYRRKIHCGRQALITKTNRYVLISPVGYEHKFIVDKSENHSIRLVGAKNDERFIYDIIRVILYFLDNEFTQRGFRKIHSSAIALKNTGIILTGGKGAGKSSFMSRFLDRSKNAFLLANDKTYIKTSGLKMTIISNPQQMGVLEGTLSNYSSLSKKRVWQVENKSYFWTYDYAKYFDAKLKAISQCNICVICNIDLTKTDVKLKNIDYIEDNFIDKNILSFDDDNNIYWLDDYTHLRVGNTTVKCTDLKRMNWYEITGNPNSSGLDEIIEYLEGV